MFTKFYFFLILIRLSYNLKFLFYIFLLFLISCDDDSPKTPDYQLLLIGDWNKTCSETYNEFVSENIIPYPCTNTNDIDFDYYRFTENTIESFDCPNPYIDENCNFDDDGLYSYELVSNIIQSQSQTVYEDGYIDYEDFEILLITSDSLILRDNLFNPLSCEFYDNCNYGYEMLYFNKNGIITQQTNTPDRE